MKYSIRETTVADLEQIALIETAIFSEPWTIEGLREAMLRKENIFLTVEVGEQVAGYALCYGMMDEGEIPTIAIVPEYREAGLGKALLQQLILRAKDNGIQTIFLEVRQSNLAAQHLYQKCGFEVVGQRKGFYRFPTEDAILMAYKMTTQEDLC